MIRILLVYLLLDKCIDIMFTVVSKNLKVPDVKDEQKPLFTDSMRRFTNKININTTPSGVNELRTRSMSFGNVDAMPRKLNRR